MSVEETLQKRKIHLLTEEVFNRIAAGEVVERPASVLKELIENALDAGATSIDITVTNAGRSEITVSDDGCGMSRDDLLLAFERHATSKVENVGDLLAIHTLGFRGEALSAIASVSRVEAVSRLPESISGNRLKITGGSVQDVTDTGSPQGTTLSVRDLFFNTPARKKFLKSKGVENGHLLAVLKRYALAYPAIRWSYNQDGKNIYRLPPESGENRLLAVFSEELAGHILPVICEESNTRLTGFIGSAEIARKSRGDQHLFVNLRWVQNRLIGHAIASGFHHLIEDKKFPFYVLFLDLPPEEVDVNVHPAKSEVKFRRESEIYNFVRRAVQETLQGAGIDAFREMTLKPDENLNNITGEITRETSQGNNRATASLPHNFSTSHSRQGGGDSSHAFSPQAYQLVFGQKETGSETPDSSQAADTAAGGGERTQVYQFHNRYIVTEIKTGIAIIDQHAAHERILYEKALQALTGSAMHGQQLLFPKIIELEPEKSEQLKEVLDELQTLGITIREFGERSFVLEALPPGIKEGSDEEIVLEILNELQERGVARNPGNDQIAAAFACKAAVKFGKKLTLSEMNGLIDQLFATQFPFTCPHGRPTLLQLTQSELERRFGRA